ncbi:hypothetical protein [uncultured Sphingomonas sp.]|uniref:hypothetical protein n=1 Tax=uncultured Sphingomonas sp. TaxID=158754 RepID=UPI0025F60361|nr:hypothetical protein [uncultured Sphingomonas sp.]
MSPRTRLLVAAAIALAAFAATQIVPLAGMPLVILASLAWTCRLVQHARIRGG